MSASNTPKTRSMKTGSVKSGKLLSRYVKKNALFAMLFAVLGLWALQVVFSYLAELENFSETYTYVDALKYILYRSPYFLEQFIPTGALLGAVVGLGLLANNSELIIMRAAGVSIYRIVAWVLQPAFIFVVMALAINQYVLPHTNLMANKIHEPDTKLLASVNGYWALQQDSVVNAANTGRKQQKTNNTEVSRDGSGSTVVFIDYADAHGNIGRVKRWHLDANNNLTYVSQAAGGTYLANSVDIAAKGATNFAETKPSTVADEIDNSGNSNASATEKTAYQWRLKNVSTLKLADRAAIKTPEKLEIDGLHAADAPTNNVQTSSGTTDTQADDTLTVSEANAEQSAAIVLNREPLVSHHSQPSDVITLPIAPSSVYLLTRRAEDLSLTQLYEHKRFNDAQGTRSLEHELAFWQKLLSPFAILSLVIVACSFVFGSLRTHSLGLRIVVALLFGLLFSYLQDLTGFISLATGVSPLMMVVLPILASAILGTYLIKRQQ